MRIIFVIILTFLFIPISSGQKRIEKIPDLVPVNDSYLLSGKLDSSQYNYLLNGILKNQFEARRDNLIKILKSREKLIM